MVLLVVVELLEVVSSAVGIHELSVGEFALLPEIDTAQHDEANIV